MAVSWDAAAFLAWLSGPSHDPDSARQWVTNSSGHGIDAASVSRFPVVFLSSCAPASAPKFTNLNPTVRAAILTLGLGSTLGITATPEERKLLDVLPFVARLNGASVLVTLPSGSERKPGFGSAPFHLWAGGLSGNGITVDLGCIDHINSVMIAWLLQLVQSAKPMTLEVRNAKPGVSTQLKQLRLDHLLRLS